jgi:hypothetical protein
LRDVIAIGTGQDDRERHPICIWGSTRFQCNK